MRRAFFIAIAVALAAVGTGVVGYQLASAPNVLRVAVGPSGGEDARLVAAISQYLVREKNNLRLRIVPTAGEAESAETLRDDKADLAVVRADIAIPQRAQTVAIMHRDVGVLMSVAGSGITRVGGLRGRRVGIVRRIPENVALLQTILRQYEVPADAVRIVELDAAGDVEAAFRSGEIEVVLVVGTVSGRTMTDTVSAVTHAGGGAAPVFIPVSEADAIAQRSPPLEAREVLRGAFGGAPPRPEENLKTIGTSHRLVAASTLEDSVVSELTKLLFTMRPAISADVPLANRIEGPDTSKSSTLPVHPGAAAYYDGEVQTFFERYSDWIYLGIMGVSILGSALAAMAGSASARQRTRTLGLLDRVLTIVRLARAAESESELGALQHELDDILGVALSKAGNGGLDEAGISAFTLGLDQARQAIAERRPAVQPPRAAVAQAAE